MPGIVVGPMLRYVDATTAAIWVETDGPCAVEILGTTSKTFAVHGHHYALVEVDGLAPGTSLDYTVTLDGVAAYPEPNSGLPPPRIRTLDPDAATRLVFGSCRMSVAHDSHHNRRFGVDVLRAYARRLANLPEDQWPTALLLLGDQVYADETTEAMQDVIRSRRDTSLPPHLQVANFEEYTHLYRLAWNDPWNRWLLSTLPTAMIFDDHDVIDDWNTSASWRRNIQQQPWWQARITGALGAYWIYQHLGNLSPADRRNDKLLTALRSAPGDAGDVLDDFARTADKDPTAYRWSYARDFGNTRLLMLDSRCGRVTDPDMRNIMHDGIWQWFEDELGAIQGVDHLLIGTSLPYLLPRGLHHVEAWNEAVASGRWGKKAAATGESIRQGIDLEHWAAFERSFTTMSDLATATAQGRGGQPPATINFLSGDVHYSYAARARYPGQRSDTSRIHQLVCSPIRNPLSPLMRYLNGLASFGIARIVGSTLARAARVPRPQLNWTTELRPRFHNALATLTLDGRTAQVAWDTATSSGDETTVHESRRISL